MVRKKVVRSVALDRKLNKWFSEKCEEEGLSCSQVLNKRVREMRKSGILW